MLSGERRESHSVLSPHLVMLMSETLTLLVGSGETLSGSDSESDSNCSAPLWFILVIPLELGEKDLNSGDI